MTLSSTEPPLWEIILVPNIINILIIVCGYVSMVLYFKRRHFYPIKGRGNRGILAAVGIWNLALISSAARGPQIPCWIDQLVYGVASHCATLVYTNRVAVLLIRQEIANELQFGYVRRMSNVSAKDIRLKRSPCIHNPRFYKFLKFKRWIWILLGYGVVVAVVTICSIVGLGEDYECGNQVTTWSNAILVIILVPVMGSMSFKLRKYPSDGRKISVEFRVMAVAIITALLVQIVILRTTSLQVNISSIYLRDICGLLLVGTSLLYPIYLSYGFEVCGRRGRAPHPSQTGSLSLEDLLKLENFREAFLVHLKSEFNAESLIFWEAATAFKAKGEGPAADMIEDIQAIVDAYLAEEAPYLLNTSFDAIEESRAQFARAKETGTGFLTVFDGLIKEVISLLKSDPLPRFLRTPAGLEFLSSYDPASRHGNSTNNDFSTRLSRKRPSIIQSLEKESPRRSLSL